MAMMPVGEGTAKLVIAEAIVPCKLDNFSLPGNAEGGVGKGTEAQREACP